MGGARTCCPRQSLCMPKAWRESRSKCTRSKRQLVIHFGAKDFFLLLQSDHSICKRFSSFKTAVKGHAIPKAVVLLAGLQPAQICSCVLPARGPPMSVRVTTDSPLPWEMQLLKPWLHVWHLFRQRARKQIPLDRSTGSHCLSQCWIPEIFAHHHGSSIRGCSNEEDRKGMIRKTKTSQSNCCLRWD